MERFLRRLYHYPRLVLKSLFVFIDRRVYRNRNFIIISNNCWGAEIYRRLDLSYNTPFVGLFIYIPDYLKLLQDFDTYMIEQLSFSDTSKWIDKNPGYPIGVLKDIEIHFMHYDSEQDALNKWNRRTSRLLQAKDNLPIFYKICDRDNGKIEEIEAFHNLPLENKISFGVKPLSNDSHFVVAPMKNESVVPDGVTLYKKSFSQVDLLNWINSGVIRVGCYSKLKSFLNVN